MDVFDLFGTIRLDKSSYENDLDDAESKTKSFGERLKSGLATAGKAVAVASGAAISAAVAGVTALTKASVDAYANYEQLVGGVETLFGTSAGIVQEYAANAYKTAGLSANEYMETVTSFSASLLQSLGGDTEAAADLADMAITDMADNANKMGTSIESLQNAYKGFSRGNFTMLDNLALGFAGTKEGMEDLLAKASEISGIKYDISSYADMVEAIHVVQTEMGITGTTAKEAATTISGSAASMKSAWNNLVTGFGNKNADLNKLIGDLFGAALTFADNLIPVIETALNGMATAITTAVPAAVRLLPGLIQNILPNAISAIQSLINGIISVLPTLLDTLMQVIIQVAPTFITQILGILPQLIETGFQLVIGLVNGITSALPEIISTTTDVLLSIVDTLTEPANIVQLVAAALELMIALADGLMKALPKLTEKAPEIIENLVVSLLAAAPALLGAAAQLILTIVTGIANNFSKMMQAGKDIVDKVKSGFSSKINEAKTWGKDLIQNFIDGILAKWNALKESVSRVAETVKDFLGFSEPKKGPLSNFHTYAPDMMELFAKGIKENENLITDAFNNSLDFSVSTPNTATNGINAQNQPINLTINVSGAQIQNDRALAEYIADEIQHMADRRALIFG